MHEVLWLTKHCLGATVSQLAEHSAPDRRARVQGSPGEILPCTLKAPGACKIPRGCNVLHFPTKLYFRGPKWERQPLRGGLEKPEDTPRAGLGVKYGQLTL